MNKVNFKRIVSVLSAVLMLSACTADSSLTSSKEEIKQVVEYKYNQQANVIDDNYRTWYEVFVRSFSDSDGDGIGDINGLISKLDYIKEMGFNGIWLMPIMQSETYHKYDVVDYYSIDSEYGTIEDFKKLISECDARGIKVIIDLPLNHSSSKNEWFLSACDSLKKGETAKDNEYIDFYNFANEKPVGTSVYYPVGSSGYYYEAQFWSEMPDINLDSKVARKEFEKIADFWLDLGVGGFRLDAAKEFFTGDTEKNIEVLKWFCDYCKSKDENCYTVAEVWDGFLTYTKYYQSGVTSVFDFTLAQEDGKIAKTLNYSGSSNSGKSFGDALVTIQETIEKNGGQIDAPFLSNHDTPRAAGIFGYDTKKMKMAAGMTLMTKGSSFVYYGEEIGMTGSGRDENKRTAMYWSDSDKSCTQNPPNTETQTNQFPSVEKQLKDPGSILNYYKRAVQLRNENPEILRGTVKTFDMNDVDLCGTTREWNDSSVTVIYNFSLENKQVNLSDFGLEKQSIRGYLTTSEYDEVTLSNGKISIPSYSIVVLK